jgi:hypothetical protein
MANIILWGHGTYHLTDGHTQVPPGCMLFFFARHGEEVHEDRMHQVANWLNDAITESVQDGIDWMKTQAFGSIRTSDSLRRIYTSGARVRNYRLTYPHGLGMPNAPEFEQGGNAILSPSADWLGGVTLGELFRDFASVGARFLWLPCRAVLGHTGEMVDAWDIRPGTQVQGFTLYHREGGYGHGATGAADDDIRTRRPRRPGRYHEW